MLRLKFIVVDRTRASFLREGESFYLARLHRYARVQWKETKPAKIKKGRSTQEILEAEGKEILKRLQPADYVIALDRPGQTYDSEGFAAHIEKLALRQPSLCFVVGGVLGLSGAVHERAQEDLSLSPFTFTHEMSRILLLEQVYRAFTIMHHEKYHK